MRRSCGGCQFFTKVISSKSWSSREGSESWGLCEKYDYRCASDTVCKGWKAISYNRIKQKNKDEKEMIHEIHI